MKIEPNLNITPAEALRNDVIFQGLSIDFENASKTPHQAPDMKWAHENQSDKAIFTLNNLNDQSHLYNKQHGVYDLVINQKSDNIKSLLGIIENDIDSYNFLEQKYSSGIIKILTANLNNTENNLPISSQDAEAFQKLNTHSCDTFDLRPAPVGEVEHVITLDTAIQK
jgi:hypothetical protein